MTARQADLKIAWIHDWAVPLRETDKIRISLQLRIFSK